MLKRKKSNGEVLVLPNISAPIYDEETLLELLLANKIEINHSCGGMGSCTTCRVFIESDPSGLPERNELEAEIASSRGFQPRERLSCQIPPMDKLKIKIPD